MVGVAIACVLLAAAVLLFVFYIEPDESDSAPLRSRLDELLDRRETVYENLRDLKFEYRSGKYSESDFEEMKKSMETEAALVLAEIEKATGAAHSQEAKRALAEKSS